MVKEIKLNFKKTYISLSGNPYGQQIYTEQVKKISDTDDKIRLVFPEQIENIASSFFQGLFKDELEKIGKNAVIKKYELVFENQLIPYGTKEALD
ncbi:hypothetical protein ACVR05_00575 [Streptococcus caprae]|uniref:DUF4325 domain-containing protein n=1 Tax=Streptococcus caprae TaxID=1640501 RepID=A0ABV8CX51_9STRE